MPPPAGATTQAQMYDALTPLFNHVTDAQLLPQFFKPEPSGTTSDARDGSSRAGHQPARRHLRAANVDPGLPIDGRGKEEWLGWVSAKNHPQGTNPPNGQIVNWNNRAELGYRAPDDNWSLGALSAWICCSTTSARVGI